MVKQMWQGVDLENLTEDPEGFKVAFDGNGNKIYSENSDGHWEKWIYDRSNQEIYYEYANDKSYWSKSEYDLYGNKVYHEDSNGYWENHLYDGDGNLVFYEDSSAYWEKRSYVDGMNVAYEDSDGFWSKSAYDDVGQLVHYEDSDGTVIDY